MLNLISKTKLKLCRFTLHNWKHEEQAGFTLIVKTRRIANR